MKVLDLHSSAFKNADPGKLESIIESMTEEEAAAIYYDWRFWARPEQIQPKDELDWLIWLIMTGRGWGKTRTGAETVIEWVRDGECSRLHFVAATLSDARKTMIEGESGILAKSPPDFMPLHKPSTRELFWPNGAMATYFTSEKPIQLRGPQCDGWWGDEVAYWKYLDETWSNLMFGARLKRRVRGIITTTPRPIKFLKDLVERSKKGRKVILTRGHTFDNLDNLAETFVDEMKENYEGTRKGRQELAGEILDDNPKALWKRKWIEDARSTRVPEGVTIVRMVVAVDPTASETGDDAGIGAAGKGSDGKYYVFEDATVSGETPLGWGRAAVTCYHRNRADIMVGEANNGGDMVISTIHSVDKKVNAKKVWATRGKAIRAEPISALYEQGKVVHVGCFPLLEDELCSWDSSVGKSPNRLDWLVWAMTELHGENEASIH